MQAVAQPDRSPSRAPEMPTPRFAPSGSISPVLPGSVAGGAVTRPRASTRPGTAAPARLPLGEQRAPQPRTSAVAGLPQRGARGMARPAAPQPGWAWRQGFKKREVGKCPELWRRVRRCCGGPGDTGENWSDTRPEAPATFGPALQLQEHPGEIHSPEKRVAFLYCFAFCVYRTDPLLKRAKSATAWDFSISSAFATSLLRGSGLPRSPKGLHL